MMLLDDYLGARRDEDVARLRRGITLRAMVASGISQRRIAEALGVTQPAVSQQLKSARDVHAAHPEILVQAAAPILVRLAEDHGFSNLAVFGSVARGQARPDSDIDLIVDTPPGTTITQLVSLQDLMADVLGRPVDLVTYGGLKPGVDDDIRRDAVPL